MRSVRLWQHTSNDVAGERRVRRLNEKIATSEQWNGHLQGVAGSNP